jgi:DNA adenine methylase
MNVPHPVLKYYGSKFRLAKWIIQYFPKHRHYVEPFGGAANVLLVKEPSKLETYNDLSDDIVNFFQILRDRPEELARLIKLTPWSRTEFMRCIATVENEDPLESARRLYFRLWMSIQGGMVKGNFRRHNKSGRSMLKDIHPENIYTASRRFRNVLIEKRDAFTLIGEMDSPDTLFYIDPPYVGSTRTAKNIYAVELTDEQHRQLEMLNDLEGLTILSGYPNDIYTELFEARGWKRIDKEANVNGGGVRTEALWLSPSIVRLNR